MVILNKKYWVVLFFLFHTNLNAEHLTGGNLTYDYLGNDRYKVKININRDGNNANSTLLDANSIITIFNLDNQSYNTYFTRSLPLITKQDISQSGVSNPCIINPPVVYLEKGYYEDVITLPANSNGYHIVYQRCCRNSGVINLRYSNDQGSTYDVFVPGNANRVNSSPQFNDFPPAFLCIGSKFYYDFSATDVDGDSLVYSLCAPQQGASAANAMPVVATKPPYYPVDYNNNYDELNPLGYNAPISINSKTGLLYTIPSTQGLFTVGICVEEYRNGVFLNRVVQDIQLNVSDCVIPSAIPAVKTDIGNAVYQIDDTTFKSCNGLTVNFKSNSSGDIRYLKWDFGNQNTVDDTSIISNPSYTYIDTGLYIVTLMINPGEICGDTSTIEVYVYKNIDGDFKFTPNCQGKGSAFADLSQSYYNDISQWKWIFGTGDSSVLQNPTYIYNTAGNYTVSLLAETQKGCKVQATKQVEVYPNPAPNFNIDFICYKKPFTFNNTSTINNGNIASYIWNFGDGSQSSNLNPTHTYNYFQNYTVNLIAISDKGCQDSISKVLMQDDTLVIKTSDLNSAYCKAAQVPISNTSFGGNNISYSWKYNGSEIATTANINLPTNKIGLNQLVLEVKNRCEIKFKNFTYTINDAPEKSLYQNEIVLCPGQTDTLFTFQTIDSVFWNTTETNTKFIIIDGTINPVIAEFYKGSCSIRDTFQLNLDCDVFIPNVFSPNNDGLNDYFNLINSGTIETFKLQIFNRWGELIFETNSYNNSWNGNYKNQLSPVDSYIYIVKGIKKDKKSFSLKGVFNLIR